MAQLNEHLFSWVIFLCVFCVSLTSAVAEQVIISPGKVDAPSFRSSTAHLYGSQTETHINLGQYSFTGYPNLQDPMGHCTVGGGYNNAAKKQCSTVGGGCSNEAGESAAVAGGVANIADGKGAAISGGGYNQAGGDYSWAGGKYMQLSWAADHTFVWGHADVSETIATANAFLIFPGGTRGNVGIGTSAPAEKVHIREKSDTLGAAILLDSTGGTGGRQYYVGSTLSSNIGGAGLFQIYDDTANQARLNINAAGNVGIGTTNIDFKLEVNGTAGKTDGGLWSVSSDARLKEVTGPYEVGLNEIMGLRPIRFFYREDNPRGLPSGEEYIGFIAQEVREVFPESVTEGEDGYLNFNMHPVNVALINAIQELNAQMERVQIENNALRTENKNLRRDIQTIKKVLGLNSDGS